ncbi:HD family phosphohydrolase [Lachnospiraceae bacterium 47-T17]
MNLVSKGLKGQVIFMELSREEQEVLDALLRELRRHPKVQEMKRYIQHGAISTYDHVERVTQMCFALNRRWKLGADEERLVRGAFLHDFYLYDWHVNDKSHRLHGYHHPDKSCANAVKYFQIGPAEQSMIRTHMWPLTISRLPCSKEAWILCLVDKYVSTAETVTMRKREKRYVD